MPDPNEGGRLPFVEGGLYSPEEYGIALPDDGFAAGREFSRNGEVVLNIPLEENLCEPFLVGAPMLKLIEIFYNSVKRNTVQRFELILDGFQVFDFFPKFLGDKEGFDVH